MDAHVDVGVSAAEEQAVVQHVLDGLKLEVEKRDVEIKNLQCSLKETETILVLCLLYYLLCFSIKLLHYSLAAN